MIKKWWENYPWRMIQTNLREIDMLDIDANQYVKDLKEFKATVVLINTSGIIASYKTDLPFHYQSPYLKGDNLGTIIDACHEAGIKVLARTDFSKVRRPIYEEHPEWAYISQDGKIVDYNGDIHVCINGEYQQKYAFEIMDETLNKFDLDGIFFNMSGYKVYDYSGNYHGICQCSNCQKRFNEMYGLALPQKRDMDDPIYRKYLVFKRKTLKEMQKKIYDFVEKNHPGICINANFYQRALVRQESNTSVKRSLPSWQYSASDNTKWVTSSYPGMVSSNSTVDFIGFRYRHVAVSPHQQKLRLAQNLANGGGLDYYLIGRIDNHEDRSGFKPVKEMFSYHEENEEEYMNLSSEASIALINPRRKDKIWLKQKEYRGWYRFLAESHYLFDSFTIDAALEINLNKYKTIIIPDIEVIEDKLCEKLDRYVESGGILISAGQSGFRGEDFEERINPPFKSMGIEEVKIVRTDMRPSYFKIKNKISFNHLKDTELIYMDGEYIYAEFRSDVEQVLNLIPPHNFGPPERCYYELVTDKPGFTVNKYGKGKGIFIPWKPGTLFYEQGHTNTIDFFADLMESFVEVESIRGDFSPMIEVTLYKQEEKDSYLLNLVNGSGHFGNSYYKPVKETNLNIDIECKKKVRSLEGLVSGDEYHFVQKEDRLKIEIPEINLFESIKIKF